MQITEAVENKIKAEREAGKTYQTIADMHHIPQSYVIYLLQGKRPWSGISLGTLERMFPRATVDLDGRSSIIASRVASPGDGNITYSLSDKSEALRSAIIAAIIDLDIPPECLAKVLKTIKNTMAKS